MGYGAGHELTLNMNKCGSVKFNGRKLIFVNPEVESWDFTHPMDGMTEIKPELLKVKFYSIELTQEDLSYFKANNIKRGEYLSYSWYKKPEGHVWSGYTRSKVKDSFPIECKGEIDLYSWGTFEVTVKVTCASLKEMKNFIDDVLDYFPDDESCKEYMESSDGRITTIEEARLELYEIQNEDNRANYGA